MLVRFAARDPGGANVLAAVLRQLRDLPHDAWTLPRATPAFQREGVAVTEFEEATPRSRLREAWRQAPASRLITGTSHYQPFEAHLWEIARETGCPSLALGDGWSNLAERFRGARPDFVGGLDEAQVAELLALGFPAGRVRLTGHPYLAALLRGDHGTMPAAPEAERAVRVLFVGEPIRSDVAQGANAPFGFDEHDSFVVVHGAAARVAGAGTPVALAIRLHPYQKREDFQATLARLPTVPGLEVFLPDGNEDAHARLRWADLVVGIGSMLLIEAIVLGRPVVSVQPCLIREDTFVVSRRGFADVLVDPEAGRARLGGLLADPAARQREAERNRGFLRGLGSDPARAVREWIEESGTA